MYYPRIGLITITLNKIFEIIRWVILYFRRRMYCFVLNKQRMIVRIDGFISALVCFLGPNAIMTS